MTGIQMEVFVHKDTIKPYDAKEKIKGFWHKAQKELGKEDGALCLLSIQKIPQRGMAAWRRYYWGVMIPQIIQGYYEASGYYADPDDLHDDLKDIFLPKRHIVSITGDRKEMPPSTKDLKSAEEWKHYTDQIALWVADEMKIFIPPKGRPAPVTKY